MIVTEQINEKWQELQESSHPEFRIMWHNEGTVDNKHFLMKMIIAFIKLSCLNDAKLTMWKYGILFNA